MKVFYLLSRGYDTRRINRLLRKHKPTEFTVGAVEYGAETSFKEIESFCQTQGILFKGIDFLRVFNRLAFEQKPDFLNLIYQISNTPFLNNQNLKEFYTLPEEKISLWWFSLLCEKNPYKSDHYSQWVRLQSILKIAVENEVDQIWLDAGLEYVQQALSATALKEKIFYVGKVWGKYCCKESSIWISLTEKMRSFRFVLSLFKKVLLLKVHSLQNQQRYKEFGKSEFLAVTMFPLLDKEQAMKGKFVNRAYGALQRSMESHHHGSLSWLAMYTEIEKTSWREALAIQRNLNARGEQIFLYEEFLGLRGLWKTFKRVVRVRLKTLWNFQALKKQFQIDFHGGKMNLWPIFKRDFLTSFFGKELFVELAYYEAFKNAFEYLPKSAKVVYFAELHAWENALNLAAQKYPSLKTIGLQHTIVPLLLLNYFQDSREISFPNAEEGFPRPQLLGCTGRITKQLFTESGWPQEKLFTSGAFRFKSLFAGIHQPSLVYAKRQQVVVALSISDKENEEILRMLADAFNRPNVSWKVLLKAHPCHDLQSSIKNIGLHLNPEVFSLTTQALHQIVPESKAMIVKESSSLFEAVAAGIPVIVPMLYNIVDLCPLSGVSDIARYVHSADELYEITKEAMEGKVVTDIHKNEDFLHRYLEHFPKEQDYWDHFSRAIQSG